MAHGQPPRSTFAYEKYKANLHALFDGKKRVEDFSAPQIKVAVKPTRRTSGTPVFSYDIFLEAIKRSVTPDEVTRTINALVDAGHQIPMDEEILSKALIHRDESVVMNMLAKLGELLDKHPAKNPRLLKTRLENLALICSGPDIRALAATLQTKL